MFLTIKVIFKNYVFFKLEKSGKLKMRQNLTKYKYNIKKEQRIALNGHGSFLLLFTGLSGAGKSTMLMLLNMPCISKRYIPMCSMGII